MVPKSAMLTLRVAGGLGLLLVIATQQKICTWPESTDSAAATADGLSSGGTDAPGEQDGENPPLTLAAALPDVVPVRWSESLRRAMVRVSPEHPPTTGSQARMSDGDGRFGTPQFDSPLRSGSHTYPGPSDGALHADAAAAERRRCLRASIRVTGPPRG